MLLRKQIRMKAQSRGKVYYDFLSRRVEWGIEVKTEISTAPSQIKGFIINVVRKRGTTLLTSIQET